MLEKGLLNAKREQIPVNARRLRRRRRLVPGPQREGKPLAPELKLHGIVRRCLPAIIDGLVNPALPVVRGILSNAPSILVW